MNNIFNIKNTFRKSFLFLITSLFTCSAYGQIYFENVTCKCASATVGDTDTINGKTYTAVNNSTIAGQIVSGNVNLCTTLVTDMGGLFKNSVGIFYP